jgi:hypothetical protein
MSQLKVNALVSYSGNTVTLGTSGDTINVASGVTFNTASATVTLPSTISATTINATTINVTTVVLAAGAVGTPSLTTSGDTNTGIFFPSADTVAFTEGGVEAMRIDSSGNVLVGTTSNPNVGKIGVFFTTATQSAWVSKPSTDSSPTTMQFLNSGGGAVGSITQTVSSTAYNQSSDYRLKENVNYDFDATTRLKQLKPARFNFKVDANKTVDGFLAHEVQDIVPEAIVGTKDEIDSKGNPVYQGIDQAKLTPILTKALQEAIARIEQLEARLTILENN